jgi:hypothetical protein
MLGNPLQWPNTLRRRATHPTNDPLSLLVAPDRNTDADATMPPAHR